MQLLGRRTRRSAQESFSVQGSAPKRPSRRWQQLGEKIEPFGKKLKNSRSSMMLGARSAMSGARSCACCEMTIKC